MLFSASVIVYSFISSIIGLSGNITLGTIFLMGIYSGMIDWRKANLSNKFYLYSLIIFTLISFILLFTIEKNIVIFTIFTIFTIFMGAGISIVYQYLINLETDKYKLHDENESLISSHERLNKENTQLESNLKVAVDAIKQLQKKKIETEKELEKELEKISNLEIKHEDIELKIKKLEEDQSQIKQRESLLIKEKSNLQSQIRVDSNDDEIKKLKKTLAMKNQELEDSRQQESLKAKELVKLETENKKAFNEINKAKHDKEKLKNDINQYIKEIEEKDKYLVPLQIKEGFLNSWINIEKVMQNYYFNQPNTEAVKLIDQLFDHKKIDLILKYKLHDLRKRRNEIVHNSITIPIAKDEYQHIQEVENTLKKTLGFLEI